MYEPDGGNVDPSGVTQAYAAGARAMGAQIERFCPVTATEQQPDGTWIVRTPKGGHSSRLGRQCRRPVGARGSRRWRASNCPCNRPNTNISSPKPCPRSWPQDVACRPSRIADGEYYLRQEGQGLLIGAYERDVRFWAEEGTPQGFGHELFRRRSGTHHGECDARHGTCARRSRGRGQARHQRADDLVAGCQCPVRTGARAVAIISAARASFRGSANQGGLGLLSAQWIIDGEPQYDMFAWDPGTLRRLDGQAVYQGPGRGCLCPPLLDPLPQRRTRGGVALPACAPPTMR